MRYFAPTDGAIWPVQSTFNVLPLLRHGPFEGMQLRMLGELLVIRRANITGLADNMEDKELVKRLVDPRVRYARITRRPESLLDEHRPVHFQNVTGLLGDLSGQEKRTVIMLLEKTRSSLLAHSRNLPLSRAGAIK